MGQEKPFGTRSENDYKRRYFSFYKFRLRVYLCAFLCLVAVGFIVASLFIQVFNSSPLFPKTYEMAEGDMRIIKVSTTFCGGISLEQSKLTRSLSTFSELKLAKEKSVANMTLDILIPFRKYWYKSYYLLKGSTIQIEASSDNFLQLLIFKGRSNLDGWIDKESRQHKTRPINSNNHNKRTRISFVYQITQEGNYYILFRHISGDSQLPKLSLALSITRELYDISSAVYSCNAAFGQSCYARLLFNSNERTLLKVSGSSKYLYMKNIPTTWYCQPRIWFFLVVFGVGYVFCVILGLFIYILLMNRKRESLFCGPRKPSVKSQNSFSAGSSHNGGSLKRKNSKDGSIKGPPSRTSSFRSQRNRPLSANGSLVRHKHDTSLPSVIPHIYKGDNTDEEDAGQNIDQESTSPRQSLLHRAPSLENISIASYDTTMSLPVTFSTFKTQLFDAETASCHSFDVDSSLRRHRNRHHPLLHQELKRDREIISARVRARFEAQEQEQRASHQSDSQLYQNSRSLTLPTRISPVRRARRDFYRDLELASQHEGECRSHRSDTQLNSDQETMTLPREGRAKRDFNRELDLARKQERDRLQQGDSALGYDQKTMATPRDGHAKRDFYRGLDFAGNQEREPLLSNEIDSQVDVKYLTLPRPSRERPKRDFYRDLELASKRDINHNKITTSKDNSTHGPDSDCERECDRVLEHVDLYRPKYRKLESYFEQDDSDQCSIGDVLDRIADEDKPKRAATLPRLHKTLSNGFPPQTIRAKPVEDHEDHLVVIAQEIPDGEIHKKKKSEKNKSSNKKDVKLRNHSSRRKDNFWKPRLSIVSEV
ncbi:uncharacterized protein LOC116301874 [Actinia tenebrosa]|uniref:Uncharacterized protein LOC116301874 n=1 Tax=Actinia tenebrosa TaxID=6105 RepID=A0A6P8IKD5_ACTTE|nr:uncharacterized protein LOC116301874 [Actinia tenebrosa]